MNFNRIKMQPVLITTLRLLIVIVNFSLLGCTDHAASEFEKVSGLTIPVSAEQKESYDDGKLVMINSFSIRQAELKAFTTQHSFSPFPKTQVPQLWGIIYLKTKPDFTHPEHFYFKSGSSGNRSWVYLADLATGMLWTEIKYSGKPLY